MVLVDDFGDRRSDHRSGRPSECRALKRIFSSLEALPSVITLGGDDPPPHARELLRTLLPLLITLRRSTGLPHKILLDEAHYFLGDPDSSHLRCVGSSWRPD